LPLPYLAALTAVAELWQDWAMAWKFAAGVKGKLIAGEGIVISFVTGKYYSMRGDAALVVGALSNGPIALEESLWAASFLEQLRQEGLIEQTDEGFAIVEVGADFRWEAHADLADTLLLDPIHDAGEAGWPSRN
jgi:hypothetical protein